VRLLSANNHDVDLRRPRLVGDVVLDWLRTAIVTKQLSPGERLSETALADRLKVSKTPVREALMRLRIIGLVTASDGHLRVVLPSSELLTQAYELRGGLEATAARAAADHAAPETNSQLAELSARSLTKAEQSDPAGFREADRAFHDLVAEASANPLLREYSANARDLCQALRQRDALDDRASIDCGHAHVRIADAIAARRASLASEAMLNHVNYVRDRALGAFQGEAGGL